MHHGLTPCSGYDSVRKQSSRSSSSNNCGLVLMFCAETRSCKIAEWLEDERGDRNRDVRSKVIDAGLDSCQYPLDFGTVASTAIPGVIAAALY